MIIKMLALSDDLEEWRSCATFQTLKENQELTFVRGVVIAENFQ